MKKYLLFLPVVLISLLLVNCQTGSKYDLPSQVQDIITDEQLEKLENGGLIINEGLDPPNIEGIYVGDSLVRTFDSKGQGIGNPVTDYYYKIENQTDDNTITFSYRTGTGSDQALGQGAFISGSGQDFTLFVEVEGYHPADDVHYRDVEVYSGTYTAEGIAHFEYGFIRTYKSVDLDLYMDVGAYRGYEEEDDLASNSSWPTS